MTMKSNSNVKNGQFWIHSDIVYRIQSILDTNHSLRISDFLNRKSGFRTVWLTKIPKLSKRKEASASVSPELPDFCAHIHTNYSVISPSTCLICSLFVRAVKIKQRLSCLQKYSQKNMLHEQLSIELLVGMIWFAFSE